MSLRLFVAAMLVTAILVLFYLEVGMPGSLTAPPVVPARANNVEDSPRRYSEDDIPTIEADPPSEAPVHSKVLPPSKDTPRPDFSPRAVQYEVHDVSLRALVNASGACCKMAVNSVKTNMQTKYGKHACTNLTCSRRARHLRTRTQHNTHA